MSAMLQGVAVKGAAAAPGDDAILRGPRLTTQRQLLRLEFGKVLLKEIERPRP
jgi:hypothetical protein